MGGLHMGTQDILEIAWIAWIALQANDMAFFTKASLNNYCPYWG